MTTTDEILQLCKELNINLSHASLPPTMDGFYHSDGCVSIIVIDEKLVNDPVLYRSTLAEELGHYFTTVGNRAPVKFMTYAERNDYDRCELRAIRWASNFLIKTDYLLEAFRNGSMKHYGDIQDHFKVTEAIAKEKLNSMVAEKLHWHIDDHNMLILTNLPNVWVYKSVD